MSTALGRSRPWYLVVNNPRYGWHALLVSATDPHAPGDLHLWSTVLYGWISLSSVLCCCVGPKDGKFPESVGPSIVAQKCPCPWMGAQEEKLSPSQRHPCPPLPSVSTFKQTACPSPGVSSSLFRLLENVWTPRFLLPTHLDKLDSPSSVVRLGPESWTDIRPTLSYKHQMVHLE